VGYREITYDRAITSNMATS